MNSLFISCWGTIVNVKNVIQSTTSRIVSILPPFLSNFAVSVVVRSMLDQIISEFLNSCIVSTVRDWDVFISSFTPEKLIARLEPRWASETFWNFTIRNLNLFFTEWNLNPSLKFSINATTKYSLTIFISEVTFLSTFR